MQIEIQRLIYIVDQDREGVILFIASLLITREIVKREMILECQCINDHIFRGLYQNDIYILKVNTHLIS